MQVFLAFVRSGSKSAWFCRVYGGNARRASIACEFARAIAPCGASEAPARIFLSEYFLEENCRRKRSPNLREAGVNRPKIGLVLEARRGGGRILE